MKQTYVKCWSKRLHYIYYIFPASTSLNLCTNREYVCIHTCLPISVRSHSPGGVYNMHLEATLPLSLSLHVFQPPRNPLPPPTMYVCHTHMHTHTRTQRTHHEWDMCAQQSLVWLRYLAGVLYSVQWRAYRAGGLFHQFWTSWHLSAILWRTRVLLPRLSSSLRTWRRTQTGLIFNCRDGPNGGMGKGR